MKRGSTIFLKLALILIGIPILALCIFVLPLILKDAGEGSTEMAYVLYGIITIMYLSTIPFYFALYQAFILLNYIDNNKAFSEISVNALKKIKNCATTISILFVAGMPLFYIVGEVEDAPGVIVIGMVIIFASMVISVFAAVLQKLLQEAIHIKSENDLTV
jgi:hypothetical protein